MGTARSDEDQSNKSDDDDDELNLLAKGDEEWVGSAEKTPTGRQKKVPRGNRRVRHLSLVGHQINFIPW